MPHVDVEPIYLELDGDRRREVAYTMGSEILLRTRGYNGAQMMERMSDSEAGEKRYRVNLMVVAEYLFAVLQRDAHRNGEMLERQDLDHLVTSNDQVTEIITKISKALRRYYGMADEPTGEVAPPSQARRRGSKSRSR